MQKTSKRLLLKLGTACNLDCPHCHQAQKNFKEHPRLVEWIKANNFTRITFSGGEPLMYFDTIKRIMREVGHVPTYRMMTNGTLLTDEMVKFFNGFKMEFAISYDGTCGGRDMTVPIRWDQFNKMRAQGLCTVFSKPDFSFKSFAREMDGLMKKESIGMKVEPEFLKINWIHQTKDAPNKEFTQAAADSYIKQVTHQIDKVLFCASKGAASKATIKNLLGRWYAKTAPRHGVACCCESMVNLNLDGTIMLCPYGTTVIGSIDDMPSLELMDSFRPEKCKSCEHWEICGCTCVASVTDLDCYVNKTMIPKVKELIAKYGLEQKIAEIFSKP